MPQIIPIKDLKNTAEISQKCHEAKEPIFITKNGYGDMVLMSMEMYEQHLTRSKIYQELALSEKQIEEGKVEDAKEAAEALRKKYEL